MTDDLNVEQRLSSRRPVVSRAALTPKKTAAGDPPMSDAALDAWLEAARYAYAYLFPQRPLTTDRAFEDRQTQVRDYNYAAEGGGGAVRPRAPPRWRRGHEADSVGSRSLASNYQQLNLKSIPAQLVPAGTVSFVGLQYYRRDGFGAELVMVMDPPKLVAPVIAPEGAKAEAPQE